MFYKKIPVAERMPELMKFVTTIDEANEHRVYRLTETGWNMRDPNGSNSPNNNLPITHWLEEIQFYDIEDVEERLGLIVDTFDNLIMSLSMDLPDNIHVVCLRESLPEVRNKVFAIFDSIITGSESSE